MRPIAPLILIFFLASLPLRGSKLIVVLFALELGASSTLLGLLAAQFALFPLLLSVKAGRIGDRIGVRAPMIWGSLVMAAAMLLPVLHASFASLLAASALMGFGHIFIHTSVQNAVGLLSSDERRGANYGSLSVGIAVAAFLGPLVVGATIDHAGFQAGFALTAALSALVLPVVLLTTGQLKLPLSALAGAQAPRVTELLAHPGIRRTLWLSAATLTGTEIFSFYMPVHARATGISATSIGAILAAYAAAALVVRLATGAILRRLDQSVVFTASLLSAAALYALTPLTTSIAFLVAIAFALGLCLGIAAPVNITLTYNSAPKGRSGETLGVRLMVNKFMQIVVPIGFGGLGTAFGIAPVFWACSAVLLAGGALSGAQGRSERRR